MRSAVTPGSNVRHGLQNAVALVHPGCQPLHVMSLHLLHKAFPQKRGSRLLLRRATEETAATTCALSISNMLPSFSLTKRMRGCWSWLKTATSTAPTSALFHAQSFHHFVKKMSAYRNLHGHVKAGKRCTARSVFPSKSCSISR